jgi:hypothetical protein
MSKSLSSMTAARSELARLHAVSPDPDAATLTLYRANLVCARIDNRIREYTAQAQVRLNDVHVGHLVGLLLSESGVDGETVTRLEGAVREAVVAATLGGAK